MCADANKTRALEEAYRQHSNNFRTWLIAFVIGVLAFLSTSDKAWEAFFAAPNARCIAYLLLLGAALQIGLALIDKYASWFCLYAENKGDTKTLKVMAGKWWLENDWPSILIDLATVGAFAYAACSLLDIFIK